MAAAVRIWPRNAEASDMLTRLPQTRGDELTVRTHLMHIYEKLHASCRTEAAAKYLRSNPARGLPRPVQSRV